MAVDRKQALLGAAVVIVLAVAAWQFWPSEPAVASAPAPVRARGRQSPQAEAPKPVEPVKLNTLTASRSDPGQAGRNPFRFQSRVAPQPERPVLPPPGQVQAPFTPPVPAGPPPLPPIGLKLIGVLERANGVKWAVLSDGKSAVMYGREGEIIDGRYTIVKIGAESIEMTYADGRGRQVIRLTGQ